MPREIQPEVLAAKLREPGAVHLLDVRLPRESQWATIPGTAQAIPLQQLAERLGEVQPPPGAELVIYCHHGVRSWAAAELLEAAGHSRVFSLTGGIDAWSLAVDASVPRY